MKNTTADSYFVELCKSGDTKAFSALFDRYNRRIYWYIFGIIGDSFTSEDILQDTFIKTFVYIKDGKYTDEDKLKSFIYTVAHNSCISHIRKEKRLISLDSLISSMEGYEFYIQIPDTEINSLERIIEEEKDNRFNELIDNLTPKQKEIIKLRFVEHLLFREISVKLEVSINTVKAVIARCSSKMKVNF